jgi:hypothetical protein
MLNASETVGSADAIGQKTDPQVAANIKAIHDLRKRIVIAIALKFRWDERFGFATTQQRSASNSDIS